MALKHKRTGTNPHPRALLPVLPDLSNSCQNSPRILPTQNSEDMGEESALLPHDSPGLRHLNNVFQLLHLSLVSGPICIEIPETLFVSESGRDTLLFNDDKRAIRLYESGDVISQFFVQCTQRYASAESDVPQFIFNSVSSGYKVLFTQPEAEKLWRATREHSKIMQRYIVPNAAEPKKMRVIWNRSGEIKRYWIHKKTIGTVFKGRRLPRSNSYNALTSSYKYDLCAFSHAGQLKKSSFSPYLPFRSVLLEELSQKQSLSSRTSPVRHKTKTTNDSFLVSSRHQGDSTIELVTESVPKAERMSQTLREVLNHFLVTEDDIIESLAYDVIQSAAGEFYLLNTKWMVMGKKPIEQAVYVVVEPSKTPEPQGREVNVRKKFSHVMMSPRSECPIHKAPFIDLKDIQLQSTKNYLSKLPALQNRSPMQGNTPCDPLIPHLRDSLNQAESRLDSLLNAANAHRARNKEVEKVKLEKYSEKMLEQVLGKVYERVRTDFALCDFFRGKNKAEINMIKQGFSKAFTGIDNYYFKRSVKKIHEGMGISSTVFSKFVIIFIEVMREEGICSDDIDIVHSHLNLFFEEVVEDEVDEEAV